MANKFPSEGSLPCTQKLRHISTQSTSSHHISFSYFRLMRPLLHLGLPGDLLSNVESYILFLHFWSPPTRGTCSPISRFLISRSQEYLKMSNVSPRNHGAARRPISDAEHKG